ncbi:MAG: hypothetical protein ACD_48C00313G0001 [uncultured bacterium]|uniref:50S ribosomal protein L17 n=1 Tax=Candidatus Roizmanbacteria bacterium RIFCSPLOWO2_01_FULL_45_11 TaxID=1802070 RepID=A0A1F7JHV4_9BACT|nr:MAG: hypothetical protein ACD_48C00313G0001 [uncultured bacterium]OGK55198.1 MAG: hypothetical protein A3B56_03050 [Candidatus Roizmanbacteria bacterium RIFCSPLOWO2_01_FULL_45_11]
MKKTGRGSSYEQALIKNLSRNLQEHQTITTTISKARLLKASVERKIGNIIKVTRRTHRRGDNALYATVSLHQDKKEEKHEPTSTKNKSNKAK